MKSKHSWINERNGQVHRQAAQHHAVVCSLIWSHIGASPEQNVLHQCEHVKREKFQGFGEHELGGRSGRRGSNIRAIHTENVNALVNQSFASIRQFGSKCLLNRYNETKTKKRKLVNDALGQGLSLLSLLFLPHCSQHTHTHTHLSC